MPGFKINLNYGVKKYLGHLEQVNWHLCQYPHDACPHLEFVKKNKEAEAFWNFHK